MDVDSASGDYYIKVLIACFFISLAGDLYISHWIIFFGFEIPPFFLLSVFWVLDFSCVSTWWYPYRGKVPWLRTSFVCTWQLVKGSRVSTSWIFQIQTGSILGDSSRVLHLGVTSSPDHPPLSKSVFHPIPDCQSQRAGSDVVICTASCTWMGLLISSVLLPRRHRG